MQRSQRTRGLVQSDIRAMTRACTAVGGVNLGQGICDVPTPESVKQAAIAAVEDDISIYSRYDGREELRLALAAKLRNFNGIDADPEGEIVVTVGSSGAYACTLMALFDPGDEIVLFEPYYGYHLNAAVVAGLGIRTVPLSPPDFAIDPDRVRAALTPRTRAILVNTPMNPCGKVFDREELLAIAEICHEHDLICLTDEVYEYLIYDDRTHVSMASLPGMRDRTITLSSYSKTFSITGWRVGYMCGPAPLAEAVGLVNDLYYICAPAPLQRAVATGVRDLPPAYYADMRADYARKREIFCGVLREVGLEPIVPDGAYYVLADVKSLGCETAKDAAMRLLHEAGVASVPGSAFYTGATGEGLTRFCYAKRDADLEKACENLTRWAARR